MDWASTYTSSETFRHKCDCGSLLEVDVPRQGGHEESEAYRCPSCGKVFTTRASNTPTVTVISEEDKP